jgi:sec-independent protein translocase protein TatC
MKSQVKKRKQSKHTQQSSQSAQLTFLDHVHELQRRLFTVLFIFLLFAGASFPFFDKIVNLLVTPLGNEHKLVYLTPGGAFSFMMQICLYVGLVAALPVIVYHVYRFVMPAVGVMVLRKALTYTFVSALLAAAGITFAYIISLPAALYFLTSFNLYHIDPMLTIDSYLSFVMTYLLAGAALFQLPLIMIIINSVKPLKPQKLMAYEPRIILASFIVAAVISPTPDALNQTLLACPVIVMYQVGIIIIWLKNRPRQQKKVAIHRSVPEINMATRPVHISSMSSMKTQVRQQSSAADIRPTAGACQAKSIDGFVFRSRPAGSVAIPDRVIPQPMPSRQVTTRSIDGFYRPNRHNAVAFSRQMI